MAADESGHSHGADGADGAAVPISPEELVLAAPLTDGHGSAAALDAPLLLEARGVTKQFGGLTAVSAVDFTIPERSIVSLIGPNGAGKTTFFNMITGVYKPTQGTVVFDGDDITGKPPHAVTERGIGRTFQNIRLFQDMTALEN